ncbi:PF20097 family protein [Wukongibacter baidiensis]|uniref:PF20097 family protein n=1 Tax=Wukongibacter baidiensis TaxID=1723361 RepID=UPI003D7F2502
MKCPYCNKPMAYGTIKGDRGDLRWYSSEEKGNKFIEFLGYGGEVVSTRPGFRPVIEGFRCNDCSKIIIEVYDEEKDT